jgi:RNA polymerase primary sigma factor
MSTWKGRISTAVSTVLLISTSNARGPVAPQISRREPNASGVAPTPSHLRQSNGQATLGSDSLSTAARLTRRQEHDLVIGAEAGDPDASRKLVEAFLPAILGLAAQFRAAVAIERQELVQEGVAGLLFAARRYDSGRETPFWAYASFWVRKAMQELVAELTAPVALSDRAVRALAQLRIARREYVQVHGTDPTERELSRATGLTRAQIDSLQATERRPRALEERIAGDGGTPATVGDAIVDAGAEREYEQVLDRIEIREVRSLAEQLDERERRILRAHYGLGQPAQTLGQIGATLGLTAERARQIEVVALGKLRESLGQPAPVRFDDA